MELNCKRCGRTLDIYAALYGARLCPKCLKRTSPKQGASTLEHNHRKR